MFVAMTVLRVKNSSQYLSNSFLLKTYNIWDVASLITRCCLNVCVGAILYHADEQMSFMALQILNFSIAYGKTAHGLAKDFGTTLAEAEHTVNLWYRDRPEVLEWQKEQRRLARQRGEERYQDPVTGQGLLLHGKAFVTTMTGRRRYLGDLRKQEGLFAKDKWMVSRFERMAINTPIQGSAADIASLAMLSIVKDKELQELGWKLLLQVGGEWGSTGARRVVLWSGRIRIVCEA
jgi:hypothetical protein